LRQATYRGSFDLFGIHSILSLLVNPLM